MKDKKKFNRNIVRLSDKILLIITGSISLLIVTVFSIAGFSAQQVLIIGGYIYTFGFLMTYFVSWRFSKRIINLSLKIEEIAAGSFSQKLDVKSHDELGQLANAINELMYRLQTGVAQDVSRHKEIAQAKTDFVNIASHQLRTPLSIIKWYIDYLITGDAGKLNDEQKKNLEEVYKSNERLIDLVNGLLDVSRIDLGTFAIEPEPANIVEIAQTVAEEFESKIEKKKIKFRLNFEKIPIINVDPRLTRIVFETIVSNAIKYTPEEGVINLDIKKTEKDVLIKITDTGCGIPREEQPRIFTKLFRAYNAKKIESAGTGLALYIVKAVIEKSGGKIWFESPSLDLFSPEMRQEMKNKKNSLSNINKGTSFFITIPLQGMKRKHGTKKLTSIK